MRTSPRRAVTGAAVTAAVVAALLLPATAQAAGPQTPTAVTPEAPGDAAPAPTGDVIVILRDQHSATTLPRGATTARAQTMSTDQSTVARRSGVARKTQFASINAFATTVTQAESRALQADPAVSAVVPDLPITKPKVIREQAGRARASAPASQAVCPSSAAKPILEPEALQTMNVAYNDPTKGAQSVTKGEGVKVAWIADGIDTNNQDFIRADGSKVFVDYRDFTAEGPDAPSSSAEAFGDASAIAAQGLHPYDLSAFVGAAHPLPTGCTITVRGVAPGASLVGLKVFGAAPSAPTSRFIGAIDWAVNHDKVDVINESFGSDPYTDGQDDPIALADNAAIAAGVTVVASTGDAGINSTLGSPATTPGVIAAAATTTYRLYAQTTSEGYQFAKSWASDNTSPLSSGGFAQNGKVPDVSAPGDLGWALCSTNTEIYTDCTSNRTDPNTGAYQPSPIISFGGTSMASPLIAGSAALVIAAYRKTHRGASPSPATVKALLMSTAKDLAQPSSEQGAGIIDALAAVKAAAALPAAAGATPTAGATGSLLVTPSQLDLVGTTGGTTTGSLTVRNLSDRTQTVTGATRSLSTVTSRRTGSFTADNAAADGAPTFVDELGRTRGYTVHPFTVKPGADRLSIELAYTMQPGGSLARFFVIDPKGVYQGYSIPQGASNFARVTVRAPAAGSWKIYFQSAADASIAFRGDVQYVIQTYRATPLGKITPARVRIGAGKSVTFHVSVPSGQPGDRAASVQLSSAGLVTSVPVSLRTQLKLPSSTGGTTKFSGIITGGNGRNGGPAQTNSYRLTVPRGTRNLAIAVSLTGQIEVGEVVRAFLVDPHGQPLATTSNLVAGSTGNAFAYGALQLQLRAPEAGIWKLVLLVSNPVAGAAVEQPFTGTVRVTGPRLTLAGLPNKAATIVPGGKATRLTLHVTNNTGAPQSYFVDARSRAYVSYPLVSQDPSLNLSKVPLDGTSASWLVPTRSVSATFTARSSAPIGIDAGWSYGSPEIYSGNGSRSVTATLAAPQVAPGPWYSYAGLLGPFATPAPARTAAYAASVTTQGFDPFVRSSTGDLWLGAVADPGAVKPLVLKPGESGSVVISITPAAGLKGKQVSGVLAVDTYSADLGTGTEIAALPYHYTVG